MARPGITLEDQIADPYFCEDKTDFQKLLYGHVCAATPDFEHRAVLAVGLQIICHEYLALVLSKKITPYEMDKEFVENELPAFKKMMHLINSELNEIGIPFTEGPNGKLNIDYETLKKELDDKK